MASNVFTKNEILQNLASKGFFIDAYTLDTFFDKWKIEAIFEDEQGSEFYDKNALDLILDKLFNSANDDSKEEEMEEPRLIQPQPQIQAQQPQAPMPMQIQPQMQPQIQIQPQPQPTQIIYVQSQNTYEMPQQPVIQSTQQIYPQQIVNDPETNNILNNISLSDGTPLMNKVQNKSMNNFEEIDYNLLEQEALNDINAPTEPEFDFGIKKEKKMGILEGAILATGQEFTPESEENQETPQADGEGSDFDDMSLLSESLEAQEKLREYVVSELSKKNMDLTPKGNEFKLDISERTLNMIARSMAKKIAKHVNQIFSGDIKSSEKLGEIEQQNKKLEQRTKELEDQNKKLRLLLAESNKNLNSYKPSIFGLYKKVPPGQ
ncbi:MAG: hypothetical protein IJB79_01485 [Candidatus Gastranaerophilales bacterium]|nr:hypothetical protein [Candidatus Gastranaerophilales bacterium]